MHCKFVDKIKRGAKRSYDAKEERMLGTAADDIIAKQLGRSPVSVTKRRHKLGIRHYSRRAWSAADDRVLGTTSEPAGFVQFVVAPFFRGREEFSRRDATTQRKQGDEK